MAGSNPFDADFVEIPPNMIILFCPKKSLNIFRLWVLFLYHAMQGSGFRRRANEIKNGPNKFINLENIDICIYSLNMLPTIRLSMSTE
jgi:hypothetical protein